MKYATQGYTDAFEATRTRSDGEAFDVLEFFIDKEKTGVYITITDMESSDTTKTHMDKAGIIELKKQLEWFISELK